MMFWTLVIVRRIGVRFEAVGTFVRTGFTLRSRDTLLPQQRFSSESLKYMILQEKTSCDVRKSPGGSAARTPSY